MFKLFTRQQFIAAVLLPVVIGVFFVPFAGQVLADDYSVSIIPSVKTVSPETSFNVTVAVNFDIASRGGQCALNFNPVYLQCDNVSEGNFYKDWSDNNSCSTILFPKWNIDNVNGRISVTGIAITGRTTGGPSGSGDFCYYYFTAKSGASGSSTLTLTDVVFTDENGKSLPGLDVNNGQVIVRPATSTDTTTTTSTTTTSTSTTTTTTTTTGTTSTTQPEETSTHPAQSSTQSPAYTTTTLTPVPKPATGVVILPLLQNPLNQTIVDLSGIIDASGTIQKNAERNNITYDEEGWTTGLEISSGTRALTQSGKPLQNISFKSNPKPPSPPSGDIIVGPAIDMGPTGATFNPPINVTFQYDPEELPDGVNANDFILAYFNTETGEWFQCDYTIDTKSHTITGNLEHFSTFAILAEKTSSQSLNTTVIIIVSEIAVVAIIIVFLIMRKRVPARAAILSQTPAATEPRLTRRRETAGGPRIDSSTVKAKTGNADVKTRVEIINGKFVFTREDKLPSVVEVVNMSNSHINISVEYDAELHPEGITKITISDKEPAGEEPDTRNE